MMNRRRSDVELKLMVQQSLRSQDGVDDDAIGVAVVRGGVTLSGQVATYAERLRARKAAFKVRGVDVVADELTVAIAHGVSDMDIAQAVARMLDTSTNIPSNSVHAVVTDRVVTLTGTVAWDYQRAAAVRGAAHLKGVQMVVADIELSPEPSTGVITSGVLAALQRSATLRDHRIQVSSHDGAVVLMGNVHSRQEFHEAVSAAWSAPGVRSVVASLHTDRWSGEEPFDTGSRASQLTPWANVGQPAKAASWR